MIQKGFAPIAILLVLSLIITGIVLISKGKTSNEQISDIKQENISSTVIPTLTPTNPSIQPSFKPQPTQKPSPTFLYTPAPTPAQTPIPTPKQPMLTTKVYLGRSHSNIPESASGNGEIKLMSLDPYMSEGAKIASLQYDFNLRGLEAERKYSISICTIQEGGDCVGLATTKTDKSGNASYSGNSGITITKDRPFKAIKVTHHNGGFCSNSGSPCLRGELSLEVNF
ncbi:hypothetical protein HYW41_04345 [Candidatus Daviesbacteria bacterium]|nr:hypothetical protein [Candidatus Daviesbacteria bacterium]